MAAEKTNEKTVAIILLAAGASARLGRPKQLLAYKGKSFLQYSVQTALASAANTVIVVLGAEADTLKAEIGKSDVHVLVNDNWPEGMASSIRAGINALTGLAPAAEGFILMVCDQPFVTPSLLNALLTAHQKTGKAIIASAYEDTFGPPTFFHHSLFNELLRLQGDIGARSIVRQHTDDVEVVPFPGGAYDVDTEEDYKKMEGRDGGA